MALFCRSFSLKCCSTHHSPLFIFWIFLVSSFCLALSSSSFTSLNPSLSFSFLPSTSSLSSSPFSLRSSSHIRPFSSRDVSPVRSASPSSHYFTEGGLHLSSEKENGLRTPITDVSRHKTLRRQKKTEKRRRVHSVRFPLFLSICQGVTTARSSQEQTLMRDRTLVISPSFLLCSAGRRKPLISSSSQPCGPGCFSSPSSLKDSHYLTNTPSYSPPKWRSPTSCSNRRLSPSCFSTSSSSSLRWLVATAVGSSAVGSACWLSSRESLCVSGDSSFLSSSLPSLFTFIPPSVSSSFVSPISTSCLLAQQHGPTIAPYVRPTNEVIETVEISDNFLSPEEEEQAHYPFVDPPLNLLVDPEPLRGVMKERAWRRKKQDFFKEIAENPLTPEALQDALETDGREEKQRKKRGEGVEEGDQAGQASKATLGVTTYETPGNNGDESIQEDEEPPEVRTDLAEFDRYYEGLGPWPSTEELRRYNATYSKLPGSLHRDTNDKMHYRKEIKTIAEAKFEFQRWRARMSVDRLYWVLDSDEEAQIRPNFLKRYKAIREQLLPPARKQFTEWIGENYAPPNEPLPEVAIPEHEPEISPRPDMLRLMEDSYTFTPPLSPVDSDPDMYDDPPDAPWRQRVEEVIRHAVQWGFPDRVRPYRTGFTTYDISWYAGRIDVVVMILPGPSPPAAKVLTVQDLKRFKQLLGDALQDLEDREQLYVLKNHELLVSSLPSAGRVRERRLLCCRKDFNLFAGSECTFVFDNQASEVLVPVTDSKAQEILLEECALSASSARQNLFLQSGGGNRRGDSLQSSTESFLQTPLARSIADEAEILKQLQSAIRASGSSSSSKAEGEEETSRGGEREEELALDQLLGKKGKIVTGRLLGSPNPLILALSMDGKVFYASHEDIEQVYRAEPIPASLQPSPELEKFFISSLTPKVDKKALRSPLAESLGIREDPRRTRREVSSTSHSLTTEKERRCPFHLTSNAYDGESSSRLSIASVPLSDFGAQDPTGTSIDGKTKEEILPRRLYSSDREGLLPPLDDERFLEREAEDVDTMSTVTVDQYEGEGREEGEDDEAQQEETDAGEEGESLLRSERAAYMRRMDEDRTLGEDMSDDDTLGGGDEEDDFHDLDENDGFARLLSRGGRRGRGDSLYDENDDDGYTDADDRDDDEDGESAY